MRAGGPEGRRWPGHHWHPCTRKNASPGAQDHPSLMSLQRAGGCWGRHPRDPSRGAPWPLRRRDQAPTWGGWCLPQDPWRPLWMEYPSVEGRGPSVIPIPRACPNRIPPTLQSPPPGSFSWWPSAGSHRAGPGLDVHGLSTVWGGKLGPETMARRHPCPQRPQGAQGSLLRSGEPHPRASCLPPPPPQSPSEPQGICQRAHWPDSSAGLGAGRVAVTPAGEPSCSRDTRKHCGGELALISGQQGRGVGSPVKSRRASWRKGGPGLQGWHSAGVAGSKW